MGWFILAHIFSTILSLIQVSHLSDQDKDLEVIIGGRPRIYQEKENLIVRLAKENLRWGYGKIEGELLKLGYKVSISYPTSRVMKPDCIKGLSKDIISLFQSSGVLVILVFAYYDVTGLAN